MDAVIYVQVKLKITMPDDLDYHDANNEVDNLIQEMDYSFKESGDSPTKVAETEIMDYNWKKL